MDLVNSIVNLLQDNQTVALIGGAVVASGLQSKVVKWLALSNSWVKHLITLTISFGMAVVPVVAGVISANGMVPHFAEIAVTMMSFYNLFLKPTSNLLTDAKNYRATAPATPVTVSPNPVENLAELD